MKRLLWCIILTSAVTSVLAQKRVSLAFTEEHHFVMGPFGGTEYVGCHTMQRPVVFTFLKKPFSEDIDSLNVHFTYKARMGWSEKDIDFKMDSISMGKEGVMYLHTSNYNVVFHVLPSGNVAIQHPRDLYIYTRYTGRCDD